MTEGDVLLEDVKARPGDDAPRLILADWLDEFGGERGAKHAEFIRAGCAAARLSHDHSYKPAVTPPRPKPRCPRCRAERKLRPLAAWAEDWLIGAGMVGRVTWSRGFAAAAKCSWLVWRTHGVDLVRRHPVTRCELTDFHPDGRTIWTHEDDAAAGNTHGLPDPLFGALIGVAEDFRGLYQIGWMGTRLVSFPSMKAARLALSAAALAWAGRGVAAETGRRARG